jgi:hypothetical protein
MFWERRVKENEREDIGVATDFRAGQCYAQVLRLTTATD